MQQPPKNPPMVLDVAPAAHADQVQAHLSDEDKARCFAAAKAWRKDGVQIDTHCNTDGTFDINDKMHNFVPEKSSTHKSGGWKH